MKDIEKVLKELDNKKWHYVHRRARSVFHQYVMTMGACLHLNKKIKFPYEIQMIGIDSHLALGQKEWDNLGLLMQKEIEKNGNFLIKLMNESYNLNEKMEEFCLKLEKTDYSKVSKEKLITFWNKYLELIYTSGAYVIFPLFAENYLQVKLKEVINANKKITSIDKDKAFQILTTPIKAGVVQCEEKSLLSMAVKISQGKNIDQVVKNHLREFAWIKNNKMDGSFYSEEETLERVNHLVKNNPEKKLKEYQEKIAKAGVDFKFYRKYFSGNKKVLSIIDTLQEAIYFRSWRTERYYRNAYFLQSFFNETAKRLKLEKPNDIFQLKADEIINGLKTKLKVDYSIINDRSKKYVLYSNFKRVYIFSGSEADLIEKSVKLTEVSSDSQIKGMVAYA
ncbi:MAG: hypothetical protein WCL61_04205, partial [bacterium]